MDEADPATGAGADPRTVLERLVRERGEDYAGLSRIVGRNPSYVQQFIKRGVPKRLAEADRRRLAQYFGIPERMLGGPPPAPQAEAAGVLVPVPRRDVGAAAGPGGAAIDERETPAYAFDRRTLRSMTSGRVEGLSIIRVRGDSMVPTFHDGDDILVDGSSDARRLRDGVYVLRIAGDLVVKRIAMKPGGFDILSDNPVFPRWPDCAPQDVDVIGRVIWAGRRIA